MSKNLLSAHLKKENLFPTLKEESWKYFDFKNFELITKDAVLEAGLPEIIFVDSHVEQNDDSTFEIVVNSNQFFVPKDLKTKISFELVKDTKPLTQYSKVDYRLTQFNRKEYGLKVVIKDQHSLNLQFTYESKNKNISDERSFGSSSMLLVELQNSTARVLEKDKMATGSFFSSHSQFKLKNSNLEHVILFANSGLNQFEREQEIKIDINQVKICNLEVYVDSNSSYGNTSIFLNNKFLRAQQSVCLDAVGSSARLNTFSTSDEKNFFELRTEVLHLKPKTKSRQLFKTIASDESKSVFNGRIYVDPLAQKTDAAQLCQGIILNPKAEINTKPELEIYADDVKAAHGAAIGQLGKDQIFYLISRGIRPEDAYKMLSKAFAGEVISSIDSTELRDLCQKTVEMSSGALFEKLAESFN